MIEPKSDVLHAYWRLAQTLAGLAAFQSFACVTDVERALARIHVGPAQAPDLFEHFTPVELFHLRPMALIGPHSSEGHRRTADAAESDGSDSFKGTWNLVVSLERNVPEPLRGDAELVEQDFHDCIGLIVDELWAVSGSGENLPISELTLFGPYRVKPDLIHDEKDWQWADLMIEAT